MAEELDKLINFFKNLGPKEVSQTFDAIETKAQKSIEGLGKLKNKTSEVYDGLKNIGSAAVKSFQSFQDLDNLSLNNLVSNLSKSNRELTNVGSQIGLIGLTLRSGFKPEAFITLGEAARETTGDISETLETINKLIGMNPSKDDPLSKTLRTIENLIQLGDPTKQLEMGLISTAASSGQLGDLLENVGEDLSGLSLKAESFSRITYELANVSGLSQKH